MRKFLLAVSAVSLLVPGASRAADTVTQPFTGVTYTQRDTTIGFRPVNMFIVEIDLGAPGIGFAVTERDPAAVAAGRQTRRETTSNFVARAKTTAADGVVRTGAQIGINANFFDVGPNTGTFTTLFSVSASENQTTVSNRTSSYNSQATNDNQTVLNLAQNNVGTIAGFTEDPFRANDSYHNAIGGLSGLILKDGVNLKDPDNGYRDPDGLQPQVAVALTADPTPGGGASGQTLILFVADGRSFSSFGMTQDEVADVLLEFGARDALHLDGGGSATLSMDFFGDAFGPRTQNEPSDGSERRVGNNLAVFAAPIPEPAALGLIVVGTATLLARRPRRGH